jgi:glycosyltransferase involved in cell wall biosynthesis
MRVCLVGPAYPYRGGIAHFNSNLAREFSRTHDVHVVNFTRLYPSFLFPGKTQFDDSDSPLRVESERIIDCLNPFTWFRAGRAAAAFEPDLVVFQWWQPFFGPAFRSVCFSLGRRCKAPVVFLCHNVLPHETSIHDHALISIGLGGAAAFLVQSIEDGNNLQRLKKGALMDINPHPIYDFFNQGAYDRDSAREKLGVDGRVILFFGYVRGYKGVGILIEAFANVLERMEATLLIVGEFYDDRAPYDARIAELSLGPRVRVVDRYVPNEEVEAYFRAADLVVLPYLSATQSGIVQTAFSFETPVVVTAVGGLPDVVTDGSTGYVVPKNDPGALADAVARFFDEAAGERMAANIRADQDRFSWGRCVDKLVALGRDAVARSGKGV